MDELKNQLMTKLGLDEEKSNAAIGMVTNFLKDKLPANMQGMVDSALGGEGGEDGGGGLMGAAKGALGGLGGLAGGGSDETPSE